MQGRLHARSLIYAFSPEKHMPKLKTNSCHSHSSWSVIPNTQAARRLTCADQHKQWPQIHGTPYGLSKKLQPAIIKRPSKKRKRYQCSCHHIISSKSNKLRLQCYPITVQKTTKLKGIPKMLFPTSQLYAHSRQLPRNYNFIPYHFQ